MEIPQKFKEMMENEYDGSEEISQTFICCVCRELLYKPTVLACGHVSCFWCVHYSMSGLHKSRCPVCRNQYHHFPSVCQILHFLLLKMYPNAYKRRENEVQEEEKDMGYSSQHLDSCSIEKGKNLEIKDHVESSSIQKDSGSLNFQYPTEDIAATSDSTVKDNSNCIEPNTQVSIGDVLCGSCKRMLFRPIVLNCGHAFCIDCTVLHEKDVLKCQVCQSPHPGGIPKVCLELDHFLEEQFPNEYGLRRETLQIKQEQLSCEIPNTSSSEAAADKKGSSGGDALLWFEGTSLVHAGVGCDSCGEYPIVGDRYKCIDCVEEIGYDLCKDCYTTRSKLPGRFNQQHTPEHKFELVEINILDTLMRQINNVSAIAATLRDMDVDPSELNSINENADNNVEDARSPEDDLSQNDNHRSA